MKAQELYLHFYQAHTDYSLILLSPYSSLRTHILMQYLLHNEQDLNFRFRTAILYQIQLLNSNSIMLSLWVSSRIAPATNIYSRTEQNHNTF